MQFDFSWGITAISKQLWKQRKIPRKTEDFVLLLAPAGGFEPLAYRLRVASGGLRRLLTNPRKPLQTLTFFKFHSPRFATVSC